MKLLCLAVALVVAVEAAPHPECVVTDWGSWSECRGFRQCSAVVPETYKVTDEQKAQGIGRRSMQRLIEMKKKKSAERARCQADGTCPDMNMPQSIRAEIPCENGFVPAGELNYPCQNINLLAFLNFDDLGFGSDIPGSTAREGNDMWVWHDTVNSQDYAIVGTTGGSSFVRITDPENPEVLGFMATQTTASGWRDMKVVNNHAYIVSEAPGHGMQVFDLRGLNELAADPNRRFNPTTHYAGVGNSHNIVSNPGNNRVFIVGATSSGSGYTTCNGGLHIVDVSVPAEPQFLGCFEEDGYVHDAQCVTYNGPDTEFLGREICFCYNEDTFTIVDTTDGANPTMLSRVGYQGAWYTHQGWTTEDQAWSFLDDELDEIAGGVFTKTHVWDIEDLRNPFLFNTFQSSETAIDHNLYVNGNYVYQSNYEAGLRVLEIDQANSDQPLTEVAYFDVKPSSTSVTFAGTWSNYPWLPNNVVAVSSIDYGFYLLRVDMQAVEEEKKSGVKHGKMERFREAVYGAKDAICPSLVEVQSCIPDSGC